MAVRAGNSGLAVSVAMNPQGNCDGVLNGSSSVSQQLMQGGQLTGELRNLVGTILGGQSGENFSLEQLLSGGNTGRLVPTKLATPSNPSPSHPPAPTTPSSSAMGGWPGKKRVRSFDLDDNPKRRRTTPYSARQSGDKQHNKGLRHFSQRVCEKVREKGTTTYNEVADELVKELSESEKRTPGSSDIPIDHKNIRRRVYDALNVLMAMNIISKEKKEIKWIGLPTNSVQECQHIEAELAEAEERLQTKRSQLEDLLVQILAFKNLMRRNRDRVSTLDNPSQNSAIGLPFLIVNTNRKTTIDCSISSDKSEYVFNFDNTFELHNDIDVLKKMGLDCGLHSGACSAEDLKQAKSMLPKAFESTLDEIVLAKTLPASTSFALTPTHPSTSTLHPSPSPSLTSTPSLSSQGTPVAALPGSPQHLAAVLNSLTQGKGTPIPASPGLVLGGVQSPSGVRSTPGTPLITVPSPRAVTQLVSNALRGGKPSSVTARPLSFTSSPIPTAKAQLHSHCPTQGTLSPLVKAAVSPASVTPIAPAPTGPSSSMYNTPIQQSSPQLSKSPGPKIVTVSKLPSTSEQLNSLLQQLQQNMHQNSLLRQLPLVSSARTDQMASQTGVGLTVQANQDGLTSQAGLGLTSQTAQEALLASLLPNGLDTRN